MKIGARLTMSFGLVLILMAVLVVIGLMRFSAIEEINSRIVEKDWVKADAAATINAMTRANARRTLELFLITDPAEVAKIREHIASNKKPLMKQ